ncbi:GNAT family N-acetyltransferase [Amycolatopsis thermophila]|uniref:GNAT superfamily N-acetyltransferase n=1 Tax=Amycolatopsis thermophila TaxID=206084 RepID=A0ABU0EP83_9PSEU|nr:GNAT family N-acetyltransferase [Amycolatopsis thermophila]MDQ0376795.1 GNAT superfamily N-acetyltransferase [Amycolatopsis thermophila]
MDLRVVPYDDPDAVKLIDGVQQEYVARYGEEDITPVEPSEFAPPLGLFVVGYLDGEPVACGGWRVRGADEAELKRMYVVDAARGRGFARAVLAELERTALAAGRKRLVLETGLKQPEALALYRSAGYADVAAYGVYRDDPLSVYLGKDLEDVRGDLRAR